MNIIEEVTESHENELLSDAFEVQSFNNDLKSQFKLRLRLKGEKSIVHKKM